MIPPLIKGPSESTMPTLTGSRNGMGSSGFKYPLNETLCSMNFGHLFKARGEILISMTFQSSSGIKKKKMQPNDLLK